MKKLVLFDFDGTITTKDSFFEFLKFTLASPYYYFFLFTRFPFFILYILKIYTAKALKEKLLEHLKGWSKKKLTERGELFIEHLIANKTIKPEFITLINSFKDEGDEVAIVSASPDIWIGPFCKKFELTCICTQTNYDADDNFTGNIRGNNCKGEEKKIRLLNVYDLKHFSSVISYADSASDKYIIGLATEKHWVN